MNYEETISFINDVSRAGSRFGLASINRLLNKLGNPHLGKKIIHIAGTNGKGSTAAYISNILRVAGYRTGMFTSPYIEVFNERIAVDNEMISNEDVARIGNMMYQAVEEIEKDGDETPTTFELVTAMGFQYFEEQDVDWIVLETGLGGTLDCTNCIDTPELAIITALGYDHQDVLGETLYEIAGQKAGIIKAGGDVVVYPQLEEALGAIRDRCKSVDATAYYFDVDRIDVESMDSDGSVFIYEMLSSKKITFKTHMIGHYQVLNAALAIFSVDILRKKGKIVLSDEEIQKGVLETRWMARLEKLRNNPLVVIDGSHNLQGVEQVVKNLELFDYNRLIVLMGVLQDKPHKAMVDELASYADEVVVTEVPYVRTLSVEDLYEEWLDYDMEVVAEKDVIKALHIALERAKDNDMVLCVGSLYMMGDIRREVLRK